MTVNTKPSLRSLRQRIEAGIEAGYSKAIPGLPDLLDEHAAAVGAIEAQPLVGAEKDRQREALVAALHPKVEAMKARAAAEEQRDLDQEEGTIRASLTAAPDAARELRGSSAAMTIAAAPLDQVQGLFADAELTGDEPLTRAAAYATLKRLRDASDADHGKPTSPARDRYVAFETRFDAWRRAHPTPRERLAQIDRERAHIASAIEQSAAFAARLYGVASPTAAAPRLRPVPEAAPSRIVEGPAFDALAKRSDARR